MTLRLKVPGEHDGSRLDRYLATCLSGWTRSALRRLILEGRVTVDGNAAAKPGLSLQPSMRVEVDLPAPRDQAHRAEDVALDVIHEDDDLLVLVKPAGMVVHPGHGRADGTLVNALLGRGMPLASIGAPDRPGIVHRLDQGTSGLLIVAKNDPAHLALARDFAGRRIEKTYLALVWGRVRPEVGEIDSPIGRSRTHRVKMAAGPGGRQALTRYETRESLPGFTLLDAFPHTGRTHQIRVHLQSIGHPIVGDERYGGRPWRGVQDPRKRAALRRFDRLGLHAWRLGFRHPADGRELSFEAPLPESIRGLLAVLRGS